MAEKIGLALSGGGFRATFFHLGVIRCLRDYHLIDRIKVITSVSGGSILAAHVATNWEAYTGSAKEFTEATQKLLSLAESDLRGRETRLFFFRTLFRKSFGGTTTNAMRAYKDHVFGDARISRLAGSTTKPSPATYLLATDLNKPTCTISFSHDGIRFHENGKISRFVQTTEPSLALAVAASAAFPPFFEPIYVDADVVGCPTSEFPHLASFTDGGVLDNSGARILRELASGSHQDIDRLIVSDASRSLDVDLANFSKSRAKTMLRVVELLQTRIAEEVGSPAMERGKEFEEWVRITNKLVLDPSKCSPQLQNDIASIRTDLDRFSKEEISALYHFGYAQAEQSDLVADKKRTKKDRMIPFTDTDLPERLSDSRSIRIGKGNFTILGAVLLTGIFLALIGYLWLKGSGPAYPSTVGDKNVYLIGSGTAIRMFDDYGVFESSLGQLKPISEESSVHVLSSSSGVAIRFLNDRLAKDLSDETKKEVNFRVLGIVSRPVGLAEFYPIAEKGNLAKRLVFQIELGEDQLEVAYVADNMESATEALSGFTQQSLENLTITKGRLVDFLQEKRDTVDVLVTPRKTSGTLKLYDDLVRKEIEPANSDDTSVDTLGYKRFYSLFQSNYPDGQKWLALGSSLLNKRINELYSKRSVSVVLVDDNRRPLTRKLYMYGVIQGNSDLSEYQIDPYVGRVVRLVVDRLLEGIERVDGRDVAKARREVLEKQLNFLNLQDPQDESFGKIAEEKIRKSGGFIIDGL